MTAMQPAMRIFWQTWLAAVVFIFPIPHTIAFRNLLIICGVVALLATYRGATRPRRVPELKAAAWGFVAVTTWLLLHSAIIAPAPAAALDNLRGDWLLPLLTFALTAFVAARIESRLAVRAAILALLLHIAWVLSWQSWIWLTHGSGLPWPVGQMPFGERDIQSALNGFLLALLLGDKLAAYCGGSGISFTPRPGWTGLVISISADAALRARNGTIVSILGLLAATGLLGWRKPRFLILLVVVAALGGASFLLDTRWSGLKESLVVGWESDSLYWQTWDTSIRPSTLSGSPLEESAYARAAWAHQAAKAIAEHPLGLGFGRDAFGRAVELKYGHKGMVSSHSGWLDFTLAVGIPGMALLLLAAGLAIRGGWRQFRQHDDAAGLMFSFLVGGYLLRCLLDGHMSGWRLGLFAFLCGVLVAAMKPAPAKP